MNFFHGCHDEGDANCTTLLTAVTPITRMLLSIIQMQFIFLNTTDLDMGRHKVISRFGLMHMVATNLCEWLYVLVEETKHEIHHFEHGNVIEKYCELFICCLFFFCCFLQQNSK